MTDFSHLNALETGRSHEQFRLAAAKKPGEIAMRSVWVAQYEREISGERRFLGLPAETAQPEMTDDELLAELMA